MAKIGLFQKYKTRENIHSSSALLLIKMLYNYSPMRFYQFISTVIEEEDTDYFYQNLKHK